MNSHWLENVLAAVTVLIVAATVVWSVYEYLGGYAWIAEMQAKHNRDVKKGKAR